MTLHENHEEFELVAKFIEKVRNSKAWRCAMPRTKISFVVVDSFLPQWFLDKRIEGEGRIESPTR